MDGPISKYPDRFFPPKLVNKVSKSVPTPQYHLGFPSDQCSLIKKGNFLFLKKPVLACWQVKQYEFLKKGYIKVMAGFWTSIIVVIVTSKIVMYLSIYFQLNMDFSKTVILLSLFFIISMVTIKVEACGFTGALLRIHLLWPFH